MTSVLEHRVQRGAADLREHGDLPLRDSRGEGERHEFCDGGAFGGDLFASFGAAPSVGCEGPFDLRGRHAPTVKHLTGLSQSGKLVYMTTTSTPRTYALRKLAPGDYIVPSNDLKALWRIHKVVDLPYLEEFGTTRYVWEGLRLCEPYDPDDLEQMEALAADVLNISHWRDVEWETGAWGETRAACVAEAIEIGSGRW